MPSIRRSPPAIDGHAPDAAINRCLARAWH